MERVLGHGQEKLINWTDHDVGCEREVSKQFGTQPRLADLLEYNERPRCSNVDHTILLQCVREEAGAKATVSAHVNATNEYDECHCRQL